MTSHRQVTSHDVMLKLSGSENADLLECEMQSRPFWTATASAWRHTCTSSATASLKIDPRRESCTRYEQTLPSISMKPCDHQPERLSPLSWRQAAAEQGNVQAMACLGHMYMTGETVSSTGVTAGTSAIALEKDLLVAEERLRQAAAAGSTDAGAFLGQLMVRPLTCTVFDWNGN